MYCKHRMSTLITVVYLHPLPMDLRHAVRSLSLSMLTWTPGGGGRRGGMGSLRSAAAPSPPGSFPRLERLKRRIRRVIGRAEATLTPTATPTATVSNPDGEPSGSDGVGNGTDGSGADGGGGATIIGTVTSVCTTIVDADSMVTPKLEERESGALARNVVARAAMAVAEGELAALAAAPVAPWLSVGMISATCKLRLPAEATSSMRQVGAWQSKVVANVCLRLVLVVASKEEMSMAMARPNSIRVAFTLMTLEPASSGENGGYNGKGGGVDGGGDGGGSKGMGGEDGGGSGGGDMGGQCGGGEGDDGGGGSCGGAIGGGTPGGDGPMGPMGSGEEGCGETGGDGGDGGGAAGCSPGNVGGECATQASPMHSRSSTLMTTSSEQALSLPATVCWLPIVTLDAPHKLTSVAKTGYPPSQFAPLAQRPDVEPAHQTMPE